MNDLLLLLLAFAIAGIILTVGGELMHRKTMTLKERLNEEEYKAVMASIRMKEGLKECNDCHKLFRPGLEDENFCRICTPKWETGTPKELMTYGDQLPGIGKSFRPAYMTFPDLFNGEKKDV